MPDSTVQTNIGNPTPRAGEFYGAFEAGGHMFHVYYSFPEGAAQDAENLTPAYPDLTREEVFDGSGYRVACAFNDSCVHYRALATDLDDRLCMTCRHYPAGFPDFGVCACADRRRHDAPQPGRKDENGGDENGPAETEAAPDGGYGTVGDGPRAAGRSADAFRAHAAPHGARAHETLLSGRGLVVEYPQGDGMARVLKGVDIDICENELTVILGESGCGKTTLLNVLGGMLTPTGGTLLYRQEDISRMTSREKTRFRRDHIGFVFQHYNLIADLTAAENVETAAALVKDAHAPREVLGMVGLAGKEGKYPRQMSGGEQQRVCIARALAKRTGIVLCDEPTGALDSVNAKNIMSILQRLAQERKATVVVVTHNSLLSMVADHLVTMRDGLIVDDVHHSFPLPVEQVL